MRVYAPIFSTECLSTGLHVFLMESSNAQVAMGRQLINDGGANDMKFDMYGNYSTIALAYGLSMALTKALTFQTSGGILSPSMVITGSLLRKMPPIKLVPIYILAEFLGALLGALTAYFIYADSLKNKNSVDFEVKPFAVVNITNVLSQTLLANATASWIFTVVTFALKDPFWRPQKHEKVVIPVIQGLTFAVIQLSLGGTMGNTLNPARTLMSEFVALVFGLDTYGTMKLISVFLHALTPFAGAIFGGMTYKFTITLMRHYPHLERTKKIRYDKED